MPLFLLSVLERSVFCFCMRGIPSPWDPDTAFFLHCTRGHSSFSFFVWLSHKSIQISEKENDEVIAWQRSIFSGCGKGRGDKEESKGSSWGLSPTSFSSLWFRRSPGCYCGFHRLKLAHMCVQKLPKNGITWWDGSVSHLGSLGCNVICVVPTHQLCDVGWTHRILWICFLICKMSGLY